MSQADSYLYVIGQEEDHQIKLLAYFEPEVPYVLAKLSMGENLTEELLQSREIYYCDELHEARKRLMDAEQDLVKGASKRFNITFQEAAAKYPQYTNMKIFAVDEMGRYWQLQENQQKVGCSFAEMKRNIA